MALPDEIRNALIQDLSRTKRNVGFAGEDGDLVNQYADQNVNSMRPMITNASMGLPQGGVQSRYQGSPVDVFGQGKGYMQPDGTIVGVNQAGQQFKVQPEGTQAAEQARRDKEMLRQAQMQKMRESELDIQAKQAALRGEGTQKPTFNADMGGYVYPPTPDNPNGKFVPVQGANKAAKPLTESQSKFAMFGARAAAASDLVDQLNDEDTASGAKTLQHWQETPIIGRIATGMSSDKAIALAQAQRDFVNAVLRPESGASIAKSEFDNAILQYFPQPGDPKEVIKQKREARNREIEGLKMGAGSQGSEYIDTQRSKAPGSSLGGVTPEDIRHTAMKHGISEDEVKRRLGL